jgi:hypothetical protein
MRARLILFLLFFLSLQAKAWDLRTSLNQQENSLAVSGEMSQFSLSGGSISGQGIRLDFNHSFQQNYSAEIFLSTALSSTGASSFTGYGGYGFYDLWVTGHARHQVTAIDGVPVLQESEEQSQVLQVGLGLNQYLLNGSKGVYSSSGFGVAANYIFRLSKYNIKTSGRYSSLISNNTSVQALSLSIGIVFPL